MSKETTLVLPEESGVQLPANVIFDLRCKDSELKETGAGSKNPGLPMLKFEFEIAWPIEIALRGREDQGPSQVGGITVFEQVVLYGPAISQLEQEPSLTEDDRTRLKRLIYLHTNKSFGTIAKLGSIHASMGLPLSIDEANIDTTQYIGKCVAAQLYSEATPQLDENKQPIVNTLTGQPVVRFNHKIVRYLGPARNQDKHMPY